MRFRKLIESFNCATEGIIHTLKTQRNMRIHLFIAIGVLVLSLFFDLSKTELLVLFISIALVLVLEMINTAIETTIDLFANYYHPLARIAKNAAAGGVLIAAVNAIVVGYLIFFDRLRPMTNMIVHKLKQSPPYITFITLMIVMLVVIGVKAYYGKGTPLRGGMPSGHSALAFAVATVISLITGDVLIVTLSFFMALLVAQARIESRVHSAAETIIGGILGVLLALFIFQMFKL